MTASPEGGGGGGGGEGGAAPNSLSPPAASPAVLPGAGSSGYTDYSGLTYDEDLVTGGGEDDAAVGTGAASADNFPTKLHRILSRSDLSHVISWLSHGRAWKVHRQDIFASLVIPEYYNHNKYTSFSRQVNGWGFRRISSGPDQTAYYHELFLRGMPHLIRRMKRPGPVPAKALPVRDGSCDDVQSQGESGGGGSKSGGKVGRRRRTATDRENEPDFYSMARARPLPGGNPPGYVYAAEDAIQEGGASVGFGAAKACGQPQKGKKVTVTSRVRRDDVMSDMSSSRKKNKGRKREKGGGKRGSAGRSHVGDVKAAASKLAKIGSSVVAGGQEGGGDGDDPDTTMQALLDQQMKLVEMQKQIMMQMQQTAAASSVAFDPLAAAAQTMRAGMSALCDGETQPQTQTGTKMMTSALSSVNHMGSGSGVGIDPTLSAMVVDPSTMMPEPLKIEDMDVSPALEPRATPGGTSAMMTTDDFDAQLDELAGILGPPPKDAVPAPDDGGGGGAGSCEASGDLAFRRPPPPAGAGLPGAPPPWSATYPPNKVSPSASPDGYLRSLKVAATAATTAKVVKEIKIPPSQIQHRHYHHQKEHHIQHSMPVAKAFPVTIAGVRRGLETTAAGGNGSSHHLDPLQQQQQQIMMMMGHQRQQQQTGGGNGGVGVRMGVGGMARGAAVAAIRRNQKDMM